MSFLLIDRLIRLAISEVVAEKVFKEVDPIFLDHFPGAGLVPGSLLIEGMAQSCGWWISWKNQNQSKSVLLLVEKAQFRHFVKPGERIQFEASVLQTGEGRARFDAKALVGGKLVAKAELSFAVFRLDDPAGPFRDSLMNIWINEKFQSLGGESASEGTF